MWQKPPKIQPSIAEIDNIGDIRRLSNHCITVFIAFSHSRVRSTLSVTTTAALQQSSVTTPTVLPWIQSPSQQLPRCLSWNQPHYHGYHGNTVVPFPMQLSSVLARLAVSHRRVLAQLRASHRRVLTRLAKSHRCVLVWLGASHRRALAQPGASYRGVLVQLGASHRRVLVLPWLIHVICIVQLITNKGCDIRSDNKIP